MAEKQPSFANVPGQRQDKSALVRRKEIEQLDLTGKNPLDELVPEKIDIAEENRKAESYAVASFVIEEFWDYIKQQAPESLELPHDVQGDTASKRFVHALNGALDAQRDVFVDGVIKKYEEEKELTKAEALALRYMKLQHEDTGHIGFPSMNDLVTLIGRMGDVVPKVYERSIGRKPTEGELEYSISHPSLQRLFMEMMTNNRSVVYTILTRLEGGKDMDLNEYDREFDPSYFEIAQDLDGLYVRFKPEIMQRFREIWATIAEARATEGKEQPQTLKCPVLYTGKYVEMHEWVAEEFRKFHLGEQGIEKEKDVDWEDIIRNSFLFSQGVYEKMQTPITRWLAMGPLYDKFIDQDTKASVHDSIQRYTKALIEKSGSHGTTSPTGPVGEGSMRYELAKVLDNFDYELSQAFTFSPEERAHERHIALTRIADGLILRDRTYLLEREGRPIQEGSRRDKWSSFIVDFGILHKGDGFYTWNGTSEPFKELWYDVMPLIRKQRPDELRAIVDKYIEMHPDLTDEDKQRIRFAS